MAEKDTNTLLTQEQRTICQDVAAKKSGIDSQRAEALLGIDAGETQAKAAEISGLTAGQVRYLITNFKKKGLDIFPEELRAVEKPAEAAEVAAVPEKKAPVKKETPAVKEATQKKKQEEPEKEKPAPKKKGKKNEKKKKKAKRKQAKQSRKTSKSKKKGKGKKKKKKKRSKK